jgi:outer membrane protein OmpA-like peptidoglycan-associated protein
MWSSYPNRGFLFHRKKVRYSMSHPRLAKPKTRIWQTAASLVSTTAMIATALVGAVVTAAPAQAVDRISKQTGFNARAWSVTSPDAQGIRYVGGDFTSYQAWDTGQAGLVNTTTGEVNASFPKVTGWPYSRASVPDGSGGWYIAGALNNVGGTGVAKVAHINADGSLDTTWTPSVTGGQGALAIAKYGDVILLGGSFTAVNGTARNRIAAIKTDGTLLDWNPAANSTVFDIKISGDTAYVSGQLTQIAGVTRNLAGAVRLDARTGGVAGTCLTAWDNTDCVTAFNPNVSGWGVKSIAVDSTYTYLAGAFSSVGGQTHNAFAKVLTSTGAVQSWNPAADSEGAAVAVDNGIAYLGGGFTTFDGQARARLVAVDIATDALTSWNPTVTGNWVNSISVLNHDVYFAGQFQLVNGAGRNHAAAVDASGTLMAWNPHVGDQGNGTPSTVHGLTADASGVYLLGDFTCLGGQSRMHAAAVSAAGLLTNWAPVVNGPVFTFSRLGNTIYMGGNFSTINGVARSGAGAADTAGATTSWNPQPDGRAVSIIATQTKVYMAGWFNNVGSTAVKNLVVLDPVTAAIDSNFNANLNGAVRHMALSGNDLFIGGDFSQAGGGAHSYIASLNATTGAENAAFVGTTGVGSRTWAMLEAVAVAGDKVFIGGYFGQVNGQTKVGFAALDKVTGATATGWNETVSGDVYAIVVSPDQSKVYVGGNGISATKGSDSAQGIVAFNVADGSLSSWRASTGEIRGLAVSDAVVYAAGSFSSMGGQGRQNTAAVGVAGDVLDPWPMNPANSMTLDVVIPAGDPGVVTSNPSGINCGGSCAYSYATGTAVTLTAVPDQGQSFTGWSGACTGTTTTCTVTLSAARATTATFGAASAPSNNNVQAPVSTPTPTPTVTPTPTPTPTEPVVTPPAKVSISKSVLFAAGNAVLDATDKATLDALSASLSGLSSVTVSVRGSAQKTSFSKLDKQLSLARAKAVAAYLKASNPGLRVRVLPTVKASDPSAKGRKAQVTVTGLRG